MKDKIAKNNTEKLPQLIQDKQRSLQKIQHRALQTGRADIRAYCALLQEYGNGLEDCFSEQKRA